MLLSEKYEVKDGRIVKKNYTQDFETKDDFNKGDKVVAKMDVQGLVKGESYTVAGVKKETSGIGCRVVSGEGESLYIEKADTYLSKDSSTSDSTKSDLLSKAKDLEDKASKLRSEGDKLRSEGSKLQDEGSKLRSEGSKLRSEGEKLRSEGDKLRSEGEKLRSEGSKLWSEGYKLCSEGYKLWSEGDRLYSESKKLKTQAQGMEDSDYSDLRGEENKPRLIAALKTWNEKLKNPNLSPDEKDYLEYMVSTTKKIMGDAADKMYQARIRKPGQTVPEHSLVEALNDEDLQRQVAQKHGNNTALIDYDVVQDSKVKDSIKDLQAKAAKVRSMGYASDAYDAEIKKLMKDDFRGDDWPNENYKKHQIEWRNRLDNQLMILKNKLLQAKRNGDLKEEKNIELQIQDIKDLKFQEIGDSKDAKDSIKDLQAKAAKVRSMGYASDAYDAEIEKLMKDGMAKEEWVKLFKDLENKRDEAKRKGDAKEVERINKEITEKFNEAAFLKDSKDDEDVFTQDPLKKSKDSDYEIYKGFSISKSGIGLTARNDKGDKIEDIRYGGGDMIELKKKIDRFLREPK